MSAHLAPVLRTALLALLLAAAGTDASAAKPDSVAAAFADARYAEVEGAQGVPLNVVEKGDPALPAIVFIHGYRQSHLAWAAQFASTLPERCHLVAFDLRGHGDSGAPWRLEAYDHAEPWAQDVARVIRATGARRPLIVAWSYGGVVAMDYLRAALDAGPPLDLAGLVLVGSTGGLLPRQPGPPGPVRQIPISTLAEQAASAVNTTAKVYGPRVDAAWQSLMAQASLRVGHFVDRGVAARSGASNADLLPRLTLPLVLVHGTLDAIVPAELMARLKALLPNAQVADFAQSGHAPFVDDAEQFNALLDALQCRKAS